MAKTIASLMTKYEPKKLADYTTFDLKTTTVIYGYPNGTLTRPLLLVGPAGCGKTQLAKLLAAEIVPDIARSDIEFIDVSQDTSINTVRKISTITSTFATNAKNLRVVILDEVDCFSAQAMSALKGLMTKFSTLDKGVFFILTTNHLSDISAPVVDRCQVLHFQHPTVEDVLPMAQRVLDGEGVPHDIDDLRQALTKDDSGLSSFRDMWGVIEEIFTRRAMKTL